MTSKTQLEARLSVYFIYTVLFTLFLFKMFFYANEIKDYPDQTAQLSYVVYMQEHPSKLVPEFEQIKMVAQKDKPDGADIEHTELKKETQTCYLGHPPLYYRLLQICNVINIEQGKIYAHISKIYDINICLMAFTWKNTVAFFSEKKIPFPEAAKVYMQANLGKYLPGNIAHFVERSMFAAKAGMGHAQTVMGTFLEIAGLFAAAAVAGMALSFQDVCLLVRAFFSVKYAAGIAVLFIMGSLVLWLLYQKLAWVRIFFHKMKQAAFWKVFCLNLLFYLWALLLLAGLMCLFVWMLNDTAPAAWQVRKIMNVYILSWAAGFVIPGAPGGIGVREVVITYLTRNDPIQEAVLLAMVVHRISTVLGDLFGYLWAKCGLLL